MATNTKKNILKDTKNEQTTTASNQSTTEIEKQLAEQKAIIEELKKTIKNIIAEKDVHVENEEAGDVEVGYRGFGVCPLAANDVNIVYIFNNSKKINSIDLEDIKVLLKGKYPNKALFENDIFYFKDKRYYKKFKINVKKDLSIENIGNIVLANDSVSDIMAKVKDLTDNGKNHLVSYSFIYTIASEYKKKNSKISKMPAAISSGLEKFFGIKFDDIIIDD